MLNCTYLNLTAPSSLSEGCGSCSRTPVQVTMPVSNGNGSLGQPGTTMGIFLTWAAASAPTPERSAAPTKKRAAVILMREAVAAILQYASDR